MVMITEMLMIMKVMTITIKREWWGGGRGYEEETMMMMMTATLMITMVTKTEIVGYI